MICTGTTRLTAPAILLLVAGALAGCKPAGREPPFTAQLNSHPKDAYRITVTLNDPPGEFSPINGYASYQASNCWYSVDRIAGISSSPRKIIPILINRENNTIFSASVYLDAIIDEDYFGKGICKWELTGFGITLLPNTDSKKSQFIVDINMNDITSESKKDIFFLKGSYPYSGYEEIAEFGMPNKDDYRTELRNNTFSITLESRRNQL